MGSRVASPTLVGRVEELQLLEAARVRAADGEPAVVLVGGEASVGKTRLVAELTSRCAADGTRVLVGGCGRLAAGGPAVATVKTALRPIHQRAVALDAALLRREVERRGSPLPAT
jgi:predicted ATPase